jgi:Flp pilus assembly protein TadB
VVTCVLVAVAALLWPNRVRLVAAVPRRLMGARAFGGLAGESAESSRTGPGGDGLRLVVTASGVSGVGAVGAAFLLAGPAGLFATLTLLGTVTLLVRRAVRDRRRRLALTDILAALRMLARELRAGAEPVVAAGNAGAASRGAGAATLGGLAQLARSDGREMPATAGAPDEPAAQALARLRSGWLLTQRHGGRSHRWSTHLRRTSPNSWRPTPNERDRSQARGCRGM